MSEIFRGFDIKGFAKDALAGLLGGYTSEVLVTKLPSGVLRTLGEYATPVLGFALGLLGNYIKNKGGLMDIGQIVERTGAFVVGNWIWEMIKSEKSQSQGLSLGARPSTQPVSVTVVPAPAPQPAQKQVGMVL